MPPALVEYGPDEAGVELGVLDAVPVGELPEDALEADVAALELLLDCEGVPKTPP